MIRLRRSSVAWSSVSSSFSITPSKASDRWQLKMRFRQIGQSSLNGFFFAHSLMQNLQNVCPQLIECGWMNTSWQTQQIRSSLRISSQRFACCSHFSV